MMKLRFSPLVLASAAALASIAPGQYSGEIFDDVQVDYHGQASLGRSFPYGDAQPTILRDPSSNTHRYRMWWLGRYEPGDPDLAPTNLHTEDRIYYAYGPNGLSWSTPKVVLKGAGGLQTTDDDHLVGSPSVIKIGGTYYMFYEAYANWATPIVSLFSPTRLDTWATAGAAVHTHSPGFCGGSSYSDRSPSYTVFVGVQGYAPRYRREGTHAVYCGEVEYISLGGQKNRFLTRDPNQLTLCNSGEKRRPLNNGLPVFWAYESDGPGRSQLRVCFDAANLNTFASTSANCNGVGTFVESLGYIADSLTGPDMVGCNQNRVYLARSSDGVNWTRFHGPARGGSIIAPSDETTASFQNGVDDQWGLESAYGAGYPAALERDGFLEVYYFDDTDPGSGPSGGLNWRVRLPISSIASSSAYSTAYSSRKQTGSYGGDIQWSELYQRYFTAWIHDSMTGGGCQSGAQVSPTIQWSEFQPDPLQGATFSGGLGGLLPTKPPGASYERIGNWGGIAHDALGHSVEIDVGSSNPYTIFRIHYSAWDPSASTCSPFDLDLDLIRIEVDPLGCNGTTPETYCTAKVNSQGCTPSIDWSGEPRTSGGSFHITASNIISQQPGVMIYGFEDNSANFFGGKLCVGAPFVRSGLMTSGGSVGGGDCSGNFSYDMGARLQGGADADLSPGTSVYAQFWYRDPNSPAPVGLTNGLRFVVCD